MKRRIGHRIRHAFALGLFACLFGAIAVAQDSATEENGFLVRKLEESLSGDGRAVRFRGVSGVLSSDATIDEITIADGAGIWLRVENAKIVWTRTALLRGVVSVNNLSAERISILRRPIPGESELQPNSSPFSIPELPVTVDIQSLQIDRLDIDPSLIGVDAALAAEASLVIDDAGIRAELDARRLDRDDDRLHVKLDLIRENRALSLEAILEEAEDGLIANAFNMTGLPPVRAEISGEGTLDQIEIAAALSTDMPDLVTGRFRIAPDAGGRALTARIEGRIGDLVPEVYAEFFAGTGSLDARGLLKTGGGLEVSDFRIEMRGFNLSGSASTETDFFLSRLELKARTGAPTEGGLVLPFGNGAYRVETGGLDLRYGIDEADGWRGVFWVEGLKTPDISLDRLRGGGEGTISDIANPEARAVAGRITASLAGVRAERSGWAELLEGGVTADLTWNWKSDQPLAIPRLEVAGGEDRLEVSGRISGAEFDGRASLEISDIARLGPLFDGFTASGAAEIGYAGRFDFLSGGFDGQLLASGRKLETGIARLDPLLGGETRLGAEIRRDETGLTVSSLDLRTGQVTATLDAFLGTDRHRLDLSADIADLSAIAPALDGKGQLAANFSGDYGSSEGILTLATDGDVAAKLSGRIGDVFDLEISGAGLPLQLVNEIAPDLGLQGRISGSGRISGPRDDLGASFDVEASSVDAAALAGLRLGLLRGQAAGSWQSGVISFDSLSVADTAGASVNGSGALDLEQGLIDMAVAGTAPLGMANRFLSGNDLLVSGDARFDLNLAGPLEQPSITGAGGISNAVVAMPDYNVNLGGLTAELVFQGQSVRIASGSADIRGGGRVSATGSVGLTGALPVDLALDLQSARYSDGALISTALNGQVTLSGNLLNEVVLEGRVAPEEINISLSPAAIEGDRLIDIRHIAPPPAVRRTLDRARLGPQDGFGGGGGVNVRLALRVDAPNRVFIRGRGVDAELGGTIDVSGMIPDVSVVGQFNLLRGRISFLDRRLDLREGLLSFSGSLDPIIRLAAETRADGVDVRLVLSGSATAPDLALNSSPEMAQDEILARLIFGRDMSSLSPFQIIRLASAVAELAGGADTGLVSSLRRAAGVDNLDVRTSDEGETTGTVGKYLNENIYSEIEASTDGTTRASINLDLSPSLTVRGSVENGGSGGIGIYFERDY